MKKSALFIIIAIVSVLSASVLSFAATNEINVSKSQLKDFAGKTAIVTADTQLNNAYALTSSNGSTYNNVLMPLSYTLNLKKGDIVIVFDESGSNYRVNVPTTGDAGIINGFLNKNLVSFDKTVISANVNQCTYQSGIIGYESQTNVKTTLSGATSAILQRANGKLLVSRPGGETRMYWINASDVSFNLDRTVTDITMDVYNSLLGKGQPTQPPKPTQPPQSQLNTVTLKVTMNQLQYTVNGVPAMFDVAPYLDTKANRSMIPMRFIAEAFGATVTWDDATKTQTIMLNGKTFKLTQNVALPDGMGTPVLVKDRFFVPLRYVSQELGASVDWDNATQTNTIIYYK